MTTIPVTIKTLTTEQVKQIELMILEILRTSQYGMLTIYIEKGRVTRAAPGLQGPSQVLRQMPKGDDDPC